MRLMQYYMFEILLVKQIDDLFFKNLDCALEV